MRGHIRQRSPGRWAIVLDCDPGEDGKRKQKWVSFAGTKRQALTQQQPTLSQRVTATLRGQFRRRASGDAA